MGGSVGVAVAAFLPWADSGGATRTGWALAGTVHRLGLERTGALRTTLVLFLFTPVLAAGAWVAAFCARPGVVGTLAAVTGLVAEAAWISLRASPLEARAGAHLAMVSGGVALAGAAALGCHLGARIRGRGP